MPEIALFRVRNQPIGSLRAGYHRLFLWSFSLFFIFGNFLRFLEIGFFRSHFSLAEGALYGLALPLYFAKIRKGFFLIFVIGGSSLYGVFLHGLDYSGILYGARLIGMIAAGVALGEILPEEERIGFFLRKFTWLLVLGAAIFVFFPSTPKFFTFLQAFGIQFYGDPHQNRFISPLFDPNYYSVVAIIPLLLIWRLPQKKKRHLLLAGLILLSILLTWSRGGIASCALVLTLAALSKRPTLSFRRIVFFGGASLLLVTGVFLYAEPFLVFARRLIYLFDDPSAHCRYKSILYGVHFFQQAPFFGVGYNFLPQLLLEEFGFIGIDPSWLFTLATFGLVPTLAFGAFIGYQILSRKKSLPPLFAIYLGVSIFFSCWFVNLWYYPYWLIPMIALCTWKK